MSKLSISIGAAIALAVSSLGEISHANAQPVDIPPTWGGSLEDRPRLTGDWLGFRDELGKRGVVVDIDLLQVPQWVATGGRDQVADYGGLAEYTLNVDTEKLGLWPGGFLNVQGMTNFGQNVQKPSGALVPPNWSLILPEPGQNETGLMNLTFTQFLSEKFGLIVGKLGSLGGDDNAFAHDYHSQFMNAGLNYNVALGLYPFTGYGGGIVAIPWQGAVFAATVTDPFGSADNDSVTEWFPNGILAAFEGRVTVKPFGLEGHQLLGFVWSNSDRLSLEQDPSNLFRLLLFDRFPRLGNPGPVLERILARFFPGLLKPTRPLNRVDHSWTVYYNFDQYLWCPEHHPDRGIGAFFRFGASDGVANPVQYAVNLGLGGNGVVPGRLSDNFGIGWSRVDLSGNFLPFLRQRLGLGLSQENVVEMYYNARLTPWLEAAVDLQVIDSAFAKTLNSSNRLQNMGTAVVPGIRLYTRF